MSQVDDEFNELEEELFEEQNDVQGTEEGPAALDQEQQAAACPSGQPTDQENGAAADMELTPDEQRCHASEVDNVGGDQPLQAPTESKPEADVAAAGPVDTAAVEVEEPPQAKERKLKPTFKKAIKKPTQKEGTVAGKPVEAQPATGDTTASSPVQNKQDNADFSKGADPPGEATTDTRKGEPREANPKLQVKKTATESATRNSNDAPQESKCKLPVKKTATKAKPASGPPDPCSFNGAGKNTNSKKKAGKSHSDASGSENKSKSAESGRKPPQNRRPQAKSAYMFFCSEQRDVIKADENLTFADVGRRLGEIWRGMDEDDKKPYQEQAEKDKARVAALPDVNLPVAKRARKAPASKAKKEEAVKDASEEPCPQDANKEQSAPKKKATGRRGGSRASKRKASQALAVNDAEDDDQNDSEYDWEADHEDVDWSNHPAECIIAVTMKGKYVVKRKGLPLHEYGLIDSQAAKRHCSGQAGESSSICHVSKEMINDFESSKKGFEKDTVDHMSSRELDLDDLEHVTRLEACAFLGDMRREGLLDKKGCKVWSFPDERMSVPIMGTSYLVQRLLECERNSRQELVDENQEMKMLLAEHGINWPHKKSGNKGAMEE